MQTARIEEGVQKRVRPSGIGAVAAALGYGLSFLPSPYEDSQFWTSSPAFFLLRCGVLLLALAVAYVLAPVLDGRAGPIGRVLTRLGTSSLFIYWVHVELVYGFISRPLQKHLSLGATSAVYGLFVALVYGLVAWRDSTVSSEDGSCIIIFFLSLFILSLSPSHIFSFVCFEIKTPAR